MTSATPRSDAVPVRFLVTREGRAPIRKLLRACGDRLGLPVDQRLYAPALGPPRPASQRRLAPLIDAARGVGARARTRRLLGTTSPSRPRVFVFADIERLSWDERRRAAELWRRLDAAPGVARILNHPTRTLCRYELLRALHEAGWNDFDVYRVSERRMPERYPVFLRREDDHGGATSGLIETPEALRRELETRRAAGELGEGTLIVEFCDTSDADGLTRKYGVLRIGDRLVPRHVFVSRQWVIKSTTDCDAIPREEMARLELDYLAQEPHAEALMQIFDLAGVDYGRIDFGLKEGRIQVWEINTDPTLFLPQHFRDPVRGPVHEEALRRVGEALRALGEDAG